MIYTIENEFLRVSAEDSGAELRSITLRKNGKEFLWQGDPSVWYGRAPVLFPVVGQLLDGKYSYNGREYELAKHGFARRSVFTFKEQSGDSMTFSLASSDATRKSYPFEFELLITYSVSGWALTCTSTVINKTDGEMYFSVGAHPAFNCKIGDALEFEKPETARVMKIDSSSLIMDGTFPAELENGRTLRLTEHLFDEDVLIFEGLNSESVRLICGDRTLKFTFGKAPYLGLWAKPNAPYVCIEPWYGINDSHEKKGSIAEKRGIERLEKGETFSFDWTAELEG